MHIPNVQRQRRARARPNNRRASALGGHNHLPAHHARGSGIPGERCGHGAAAAHVCHFAASGRHESVGSRQGGELEGGDGGQVVGLGCAG